MENEAGQGNVGANDRSPLPTGGGEQLLAPAVQGKRNYITAIVAFLILAVAIPGVIYIKERPGSDYYLKFQTQGRGYVLKGEWEKAAAEFENAAKYRPDIFETHYDLGMTYLKLKNIERAVAELKEAVRINPGNINIRYSLGSAYQSMGRLEEALKEYHIVAKAMPNSPEVFNNVGLIQSDAGDYDKAVKAFKHAIGIKPDYYPAYVNLGKVYEAQGEMESAKREYQKVQKMASEKPETMQYARIAEKRLVNLK